MRWPVLVAAATLTTALVGCDTVRDKIPFLSKKGVDTAAVDTAAAVAAVPEQIDTVSRPETEVAEPTPTPVQQAPTTRPVTQLVDEPWEPVYTGTVQPGMTREEVVTIWGPPVAERVLGNREYLYFRNGCEVTCGTFDVVFLEGGQVVDAIVRGVGHDYAGVSSSPRERAAEYTPPIPSSGSSGQ